MERDVKISEIATLFLKLGCIGFGGPAAHIAMMRQEVVFKNKWMGEQHFLDLLGATNLIPGPNSTEMAIQIGYEKGGWKGLVVAGLCFISPAVVITGIVASLYRQYGQLPEMQPLIYGIKPAIIAVMVGAVFPLARKAAKSAFLTATGIGVLALSLSGADEICLLFGAGLAAVGLYGIRNRKGTLQGAVPLVFFQVAQNALLSETNARLFWFFLKIGAVLYGSGYVLFSFIDAELVAAGLLSRKQLMDAIAVGQFTPGPVFSSVTFIGYQVNGLAGAALSTVAVFLPSFILVALLNPLAKKMRRSEGLSVFLDAVNVASVAIIAAICVTMGREAIADWPAVLIALASAAVVFKFEKANSAAVVVGGALLGCILYQI